MTHEDPEAWPGEHHHGPEHDEALPDATSIPETTDVEASLAPPLHDTAEKLLGPTWAGAEPGWWERPETATQLPRWAGTEPNEV